MSAVTAAVVDVVYVLSIAVVSVPPLRFTVIEESKTPIPDNLSAAEESVGSSLTLNDTFTFLLPVSFLELAISIVSSPSCVLSCS